MRILSSQEKIKRGCDYCAHVQEEDVNDTVKKVCPHDECPYHELDEFDTYSEYLRIILFILEKLDIQSANGLKFLV